jgi:hypothetical protein
MHLIREILLAVEACESGVQRIGPRDLPGHDEQAVAYHLGLAIQAGLVSGSCAGGDPPAYCMARSLTWEGHDLLDAMRGPTLWNAVVKTAREKGLELTVDVVKAIAKQAATRLLES